MHPLYFSSKNKKLIIKEIKGSKNNAEKLISRGFVPNTEIAIQREDGENLVILLNSSYFILSKELAFSIYVEEIKF